MGETKWTVEAGPRGGGSQRPANSCHWQAATNGPFALPFNGHILSEKPKAFAQSLKNAIMQKARHKERCEFEIEPAIT